MRLQFLIFWECFWICKWYWPAHCRFKVIICLQFLTRMHFDWQKNCGENGDDSNTLYYDGEVRGSRFSVWKKYQQISHIGHCALKTLIRIKWQHKPLQDLKIILFISSCIKNGEDMNAKNDLYSYVHCTTNVNYSLRSKFGK